MAFLVHGGALGDFPHFLVAQFSWQRFLVIQIWLMVLFLVYVTAHELNTLFGDGELARLFLRWHSSGAKLTRRQRIRLLTRLNRLTEANPVEVIGEKGLPAHTELVVILREQAAVRRNKNSRVEQATPMKQRPLERRYGDSALQLLMARTQPQARDRGPI